MLNLLLYTLNHALQLCFFMTFDLCGYTTSGKCLEKGNFKKQNRFSGVACIFTTLCFSSFFYNCTTTVIIIIIKPTTMSLKHHVLFSAWIQSMKRSLKRKSGSCWDADCVISAQNDACVQHKAGSDRKDFMKLAGCLVSHKVWVGVGQITVCAWCSI